ncbi:MAG: acyl-CoA dehydrogenase family protein [Acidimicrobiales bacterium]
MDLRLSDEDEAFRREARTFLTESMAGEFAVLRGRGHHGDDDALIEERLAWERHLGSHGWTCVGWPKEHGGRGLSIHQQVIWFVEYARVRAPGRLSHLGETLLGPTLIAFGSREQQQRFLPAIREGREIWCQGYSEPDAGSDLANLKTRAVLDDSTGEWVIDGQKVWTSWAQWADWCFVLARTNSSAPKHKGISYVLVPMCQDGVEVRPIHQITGGSEFNEVFFSGARTAAENVVGDVDDGWRVAMGTLAFERGVSTLGQNLMFSAELDEILERAGAAGRLAPVVRQRVVAIWTRLRLMRLTALRILSGEGEGEREREREREGEPPAAMITKLFWSELHRDLGELAVDLLAPAMLLADDPLQRLFLFSRSETIYAGSSEIQRNLIGERALGLPREPR